MKTNKKNEESLTATRDLRSESGGEATKGLFKLPPEMRNHVYRNLLIRTAPHRRVHPNILQTSKQILDEAKDISIHENVIHIGLSLNEQDPSDVKLTAHIHKDEPIISAWEYRSTFETNIHNSAWDEPQVATSLYGTTTYRGLLQSQVHWPLYMASISRLCIRISADAPQAVKDFFMMDRFPLWPLSHVLCSLGSFFENQGHRLDELTLDFDLKPFDSRDSAKRRYHGRSYGVDSGVDDGVGKY